MPIKSVSTCRLRGAAMSSWARTDSDAATTARIFAAFSRSTATTLPSLRSRRLRMTGQSSNRPSLKRSRNIKSTLGALRPGACDAGEAGGRAMNGLIDIRVPDIGDFKDVPVIEVFVKPGDTVKAEDPLVALESDKATMEVPSPRDGTVKSVVVKVGDKVSEGSIILELA